MIAQSLKTGEHLSDILKKNGWTYDDLIYKNSNSKVYKHITPICLDDFKKNTSIPLVSFFSGCGGLDLGAEAVGFSNVACFELDELCCKTLRKNRPNWTIMGPPYTNGDVSNFERIKEQLNAFSCKNFPGIFVGGPPCQPFSIAANQRFSKSDENFKRIGFLHEKNGNLLFDYINIIKEFKPRAFLIENVPGLFDIDNGKQLLSAISELKNSGYYVEDPLIIDTSMLGLPQQRIRLFVIGCLRKKIFHEPDTVSHLCGCGNVLLNNPNTLKKTTNHETREHTAVSIERYSILDYGKRDLLGRINRLDPSLPSRTVIAGGTKGGGRSHLHPEIPRTLSVRESARLQTFPDDFCFLGPTARQFTQVGNAVPPVLGAKITEVIRKSFFDK